LLIEIQEISTKQGGTTNLDGNRLIKLMRFD